MNCNRPSTAGPEVQARLPSRPRLSHDANSATPDASSSNLCDTLIEHLHGRAVSSTHNKYELVGATMLCHRPVPPLQPAFRLASRSSDQTWLSKRRQPVNGDSLRAILRNFAQCASTSACHLLVADSSLAASVQSQTRERRPSSAATLTYGFKHPLDQADFCQTIQPLSVSLEPCRQRRIRTRPLEPQI